MTNLVVAEIRVGLVEFSHTILFTLVNALIFFLILKHFLFKPIQKFMAARKQEIDQQYTDAKEAEDQALQMKAEYQMKIEGYEAEGATIIKNYTEKANIRANDMLDQAKREAEQVKKKAEKDISLERQKVVHELKNELSDLTVLAASKLVKREVSQEDHHRLIQEAIEEAGDLDWLN